MIKYLVTSGDTDTVSHPQQNLIFVYLIRFGGCFLNFFFNFFKSLMLVFLNCSFRVKKKITQFKKIKIVSKKMLLNLMFLNECKFVTILNIKELFIKKRMSLDFSDTVFLEISFILL